VAEHKLVYLRNLDTQDILDVDLPMRSSLSQYQGGKVTKYQAS